MLCINVLHNTHLRNNIAFIYFKLYTISMWSEALAKLLSPSRQPRRRMLYEKVFKILAEKGQVGVLDVTGDGFPLRTVQYHFKDLVQRGVLQRHKSKTGGWYYTWGAEFEYILRKGYEIVIKGRRESA